MVNIFNESKTSFTDFRITADKKQAMKIGGVKNDFFELPGKGTERSILFEKGKGNGIPSISDFAVNLTGFAAGTKIIGTPSTSSPELPTIAMFAMSILAFLAWKARLKRAG